MAAILLAGFLASCMSVSIPQSHYIGQAMVNEDPRENYGLKEEFIKRYPLGTPIAKFTDDLKSLGATCTSRSSPERVHCKLSIISKELILLPVFIPLDNLPSYGVLVDIRGHGGLIEAIEVKAYKLHPSGLLF